MGVASVPASFSIQMEKSILPLTSALAIFCLISISFSL